MNTTLLDQFIDHCDGETFPAPVAFDSACKELEASPAVFVDAFALRVAERYAAAEMSFDRADALMNDLYSFHLSRYNEILPKLAWSLYLAFDSGEFSRSKDPPDTDPSEKYTRPEVEAILSQLSAGSGEAGG